MKMFIGIGISLVLSMLTVLAIGKLHKSLWLMCECVARERKIRKCVYRCAGYYGTISVFLSALLFTVIRIIAGV